ncbi:MAG: hypothetical protein IT461_05520 [Planctomycetes bacterium]|nr:hypothetical protein [Planctomycetota bacterium]
MSQSVELPPTPPTHGLFGSAYMALRLASWGSWIYLLITLTPSGYRGIVAPFALYGIAAAIYTVVAGFAAMRGSIIGVRFGVCEIVVGTLTWAPFAYGGNVLTLHFGVGLLLGIGLLVLGFNAHSQHKRYRQIVVAQLDFNATLGVKHRQFPSKLLSSTAPDIYSRQSPLKAPLLSPPSTHNALVSVLTLAAVLEYDRTPIRLERAKAAAKQLLGDKCEDVIAGKFAETSQTSEWRSKLAELGACVASDSRLCQRVRECIEFILKDSGYLTPVGEQFLMSYDVAVGISGNK